MDWTKWFRSCALALGGLFSCFNIEFKFYLYVIGLLPWSCASLGGFLIVWSLWLCIPLKASPWVVHPLEALLFGIVGLCVVVVSSCEQYLFLPAHSSHLQVSCLVSYFACITCISCIFIVVSLSFIVTSWIVISFIYLYLAFFCNSCI